MAERPSHILVGPFRFRIEFDEAPLRESFMLDDVMRFGLTIPERLLIVISPNRPEDALKQTLVHETLHAINWTYNIIFVALDPKSEEHEREETYVSVMSSPLLDTLKRNPQVTAWLLEE